MSEAEAKEKEIAALEDEAFRIRREIVRKKGLYARGHALDNLPRTRAMPKLTCEGGCNGHAVARFVCNACHIGLCKKHAHIAEVGPYAGRAFCRDHAQGWQ